MNDISTRHTAGLFWVPGRSGVQGNKIADKLPRDDTVKKFVKHEPVLGDSPETGSKIDFGSYSNCKDQTYVLQSRVVTGLRTGNRTLRRHLYLMGLTNSPLCRRCEAEGRNLSPHSVRVRNSGFTQTCISGFLSWTQRKFKRGGNLKLQYRNWATITCIRLWGTKGPSKA